MLERRDGVMLEMTSLLSVESASERERRSER